MLPCGAEAHSKQKRRRITENDAIEDTFFIVVGKVQRVIGFLVFDAYLSYDSSCNLKDLSMWHEEILNDRESAHRWDDWQNYVPPLQCNATHGRVFSNCVELGTDFRGKFLSKQFADTVMRTDLVGGGRVGVAARKWRIIRLAKWPDDLDARVRASQPVSIPLYAAQLRRLGVSGDHLPHQEVSIGHCNWETLYVDGESDNEAEAESSDDDGVQSRNKKPVSCFRQLQALKFHNMLRPNVQIKDALLIAADLLLSGDICTEIKTSLVEGTLLVPSRQVLRRAAQKLDIGMTLWDQRLWHQQDSDVHIVSALSTDASRQQGHNYLLTRNDQLIIPGGLPPVASRQHSGSPLI